MILEINLNNFIRESEHNSMSCTHPLFDVDNFLNLSLFLSTVLGILLHDAFWLIITLKVAPEMLK